MSTATFRFYGPLNDFLLPERRGHAFECPCAQSATVKHMIEALGVPHTEVEIVLVNGESADFSQRLKDGDRVAVYPVFASFDVSPLVRVREHPPRVVRFIADAHLGGLARLLRMAGFDTLYENHLDDGEIEAIAAREGRIVLSRDLELLKRRSVVLGCYVRNRDPELQLREIFDRFDLARSVRPFMLCLICNAPLRAIPKEEVLERIPPRIRESFEHFTTCDACRRIYWKGSHWQRMRQLVEALLREDGLA